MNGIIFALTLMTTNPVEFECLAQNAYFEARNQSKLGQIAVSHVVLNRMMSDRYPDTICEVVKQGEQNSNGSMKRNRCQFSWYCDGLSDVPRDSLAWGEAQIIAIEALQLYKDNGDITNGALWYHSKNVKPRWSSHYIPILTIDDHIFYVEGL